MKFTKMEGLGNDYIYINDMHYQIDNPNQLSKQLSDRNFGIGGDGIILLVPSKIADFRMRMYNRDGSEGEMCGNGVRCLAKFIYDQKLTDKLEIDIETNGGIKSIQLFKDKKDNVSRARVNMGSPILNPKDIPFVYDKDQAINVDWIVDGITYKVTAVNTGNPHGVIFMDEIDSLDLEKNGFKFENSKYFPKKVNTEFVQVIDRKNIKVRVYERGAGETLACGTGACASVVAAVLNNHTDEKVKVHFKKGSLDIYWDRSENIIYMEGAVRNTFIGEFNIEDYD